MNLLSGLIATVSSNHFGAGGGAPSNGASGPCVAVESARNSRMRSSDISLKRWRASSNGSGMYETPDRHSARSGEPFNPCAVGMTTRQPRLFAHPVGITDQREDIELAVELE